MYKWEVSFSEPKKVRKDFLKKIFYLLNKGTSYTDFNGKFVGKINYVDGPLGGVCIRSDHSLDRDGNENRFIMFKVCYLDKYVLYFIIAFDELSVHDFLNGHWANSVGRATK